MIGPLEKLAENGGVLITGIVGKNLSWTNFCHEVEGGIFMVGKWSDVGGVIEVRGGYLFGFRTSLTITLILSSLNSERTHITLQENCSCFALLN